MVTKRSKKADFLPSIERVLNAEDPRAVSEAETESAGINSGALWQWVLDEAKERAEALLPGEGIIERLLDPETRQELMAAIKGDKIGQFRERYERLLQAAPVSAAQIEEIFASLPVDGGLNFSSLIWKESFPPELLLDLAMQERFLGALGHRRGPKELLEYMAFRHDFSESITTLALDYFGQEETPIAEFEAFVRQYHHCRMMEHNLLRSERVSQERIALATEIFVEMKNLAREDKEFPPPWAPIRHQDFYLVPHCIVFLYKEMLVYLDGSWDEVSEGYPNAYTVYELPRSVNLDKPWGKFSGQGLRKMGEIPLESIRLDASCRLAIDTVEFEAWGLKHGWEL